MIEWIQVKTKSRSEMIDITSDVEGAIKKSKVEEGICVVFVTHTTAGVTINEGADPSVQTDIVSSLNRQIPRDAGYRHAEGNSDSHIKTTLTGPSITILVEGGKPVLGTWQSIFFCEYDGPRQRRVAVKAMEG